LKINLPAINFLAFSACGSFLLLNKNDFWVDSFRIKAQVEAEEGRLNSVIE